MPWFKIDDGFHSHPKVLAAGNAAMGLWSRCGSYCSDHSTDGFVPEVLAKTYGTRAEIARLVELGWWRKVEGGYTMHDFLDYNPSAEQVRAERSAAAERQRLARERRAASRNGSHPQSRTPSHVASHRDTEDPSRCDFACPDPTRPDKKERAQDDSLAPLTVVHRLTA